MTRRRKRDLAERIADLEGDDSPNWSVTITHHTAASFGSGDEYDLETVDDTEFVTILRVVDDADGGDNADV
ncbi:hypothetical protein [Natrinema sp. SYSU A 869]|uniref:hypothetical protein n=1 Tax=Natrinema sp. SYSU A 869 TaxID=2871694 RepID=UPI001CA46A5D|nr:hypothetical protein [Natrinema sp. SYSU A 869]